MKNFISYFRKRKIEKLEIELEGLKKEVLILKTLVEFEDQREDLCYTVNRIGEIEKHLEILRNTIQ